MRVSKMSKFTASAPAKGILQNGSDVQVVRYDGRIFKKSLPVLVDKIFRPDETTKSVDGLHFFKWWNTLD